MERDELFHLTQDDEGHWYVIKYGDLHRFQAWLIQASGPHGGRKEDWKYFESCRVDGPHRVGFAKWQEVR